MLDYYDDWDQIQRSTPCEVCHSASPWVNSPSTRLRGIRKYFIDDARFNDSNHLTTYKFFNIPFDITKSQAMPKSFGSGSPMTQLPYKIVGQKRIEEMDFLIRKDPNQTAKIGTFTKGEWRPEGISKDISNEHVEYCVSCHVNVMSPRRITSVLMFSDLGTNVLLKPEDNWHDVLFGTKLNPLHTAGFINMKNDEIDLHWQKSCSLGLE